MTEILISALAILIDTTVIGGLSVYTLKQGIKVKCSMKKRKQIRKNKLKYYDKFQDVHGEKFHGKTYAKFPDLSAKHFINVLNNITDYPEELIDIVATFQNYTNPLDLKLCVKNLQNCHITKSKKNYIKNLFNCFNPSGVYYHENKDIVLFSDKSFVLTHEFIHLCSAENEKYIGFHINIENEEIGRGINEGYTELINQRIFKNPNHCYKHNVRIMRMLETFFDDYRDMEHAFFHSDLETLYRKFCEYGTKEEFLEISQDLDYFAFAPIKINDQINSVITELNVYKIIKRSNNSEKIKRCEDILDERTITRIIRKGPIKLQTLNRKKPKIKTLKNA